MFLNLKSIHVLVVEDIAPMRELISEMLSAMGIGTVSVACDGREGLSMYRGLKPDIIITDWEMPDMNGLELIKHVRRDPKSPKRHIPIIMLTGFSSKDRISQARNDGVTEFMVKPFSAEDLAKRIQYVIRNPRDFIVVPNFVGPDRRRKEDESNDNQVRQKDTDKKLKADTTLAAKAGVGTIDKNAVERSQRIMNENKIDFIPIARQYLQELKQSLDAAKKQDNPPSNILQDFISPIMQLKANARILGFDLVGNLTNIVLNFLETLNEIDSHVLDIVDSQYRTLNHLVENDFRGEGGKTGVDFERELHAACQRYLKVRAQLKKKDLEKKSSQ